MHFSVKLRDILVEIFYKCVDFGKKIQILFIYLFSFGQSMKNGQS